MEEEQEQQEQEQDVYDDDDHHHHHQEISCGSGVPSSAHGGRDGDAVLLQLEVGVWVGDDVWGGGRKRRRSDEKIQMRETELETKFVAKFSFF